MQLPQASPVCVIPSSTLLYVLYQLWFEKGFTADDKQLRWDSPIRQEKNKVISSMKYTLRVLDRHPDLKAVLLATWPNIDSAEYMAWNTTYNKACTSLAEAVISAVWVDFKKKFKLAATISSLDSKFRPPKLKKVSA